MSSSYVRAKIKTRLQDLITAQGWAASFVEIENKREDAPVKTDWLAVEFINSDETQITTGAPGNNTFRESGDFLVHYVTQSGIGSDTLLARLDVVRDDFRHKVIDGIVIDETNPPDTTEGASLSNARGNWYGGSVLISYEYDIRG